MGRKSKLTESQWVEIERRVIAGETYRALAKEFGVGWSTIGKRVSAQTKEIKAVAEQIVSTERRIMALPIGAQITAQNLAAKLRAISDNLASAAHYGAMTAHRLSGLAHGQLDKIDDASPLQSADTLKGVAVLTKMANEASTIPLNLLAANKEAVKDLGTPKKLEEMTDDELLAILEEKDS
ncbi:MAG: Hin recombinase [Patescibacteria group bacterium]|nr:Hin recombinase [Patescibacteria group bacterium]